MPFPSTFSGFTLPNPTQKLNSPSQSSIIANLSSTLGQVEAVLGRDGDSSILGTIIGDLRSPDSGGGGHVQTAAKGGTGQTAYTKGDVLVAQNASTLTKLAVDVNDGRVLTIDSSVATGVKWGTAKGALLYGAASTVALLHGAERSVFSISVPGSTLSAGNVVRTTYDWQLNDLPGGTPSVFAKVQWGSSTLGFLRLDGTGTVNTSIKGILEHRMTVGATAAQTHTFFTQPIGYVASSIFTIRSSLIAGFTSAQDVSASVLYGMTLQHGHNGTSDIIARNILVEQIT
jgi:hypothetical protein